MNDTKWMFDAEAEFYAQQHWLNPLLNIAARLLRRNYFWYWREDGSRHLWFGR